MQTKTVLDFQHGDKKAYRIIFDSLYPVMCLYAEKFVKDADDAEDISQEIFVELWNQRAKFESFEQIKAFLYLSIKNKCFNFIKHLNIKKKYVESVQLDDELLLDNFIIEAEIVNNLNEAVKSLPEQQRLVILLSLQGLKNEDIAENMNISLNTVKLYKKNAYKNLRSKIYPSLLFLLSL